MNKDEIKKWLGRYRYINHEVWSRTKEAKELRALASSITGIDYSRDQVQTTKQKGASFERLIDLAIEIDREVESLEKIRTEIEKTVSKVEDHRLRIILRMKYMNGLNDYIIYKKLDLGERWYYELKDKAVEEIERIISL